MSPRSPLESTVSVRKGVVSRAPFLITRSLPACSQTRSRPSGASAIAVGLVRPGYAVSVKPAGSVAPTASAAASQSGATASASRFIKTTATPYGRTKVRTRNVAICSRGVAAVGQ